MTTMTIEKRFVLDVDDSIRTELGRLLGSEQIVLASGSPRRREILRLAGVDCRTDPPDVDESVPPNAEPIEFAIRLAKEKLAATKQTGQLAVAADTIVVLDNIILGKPIDAADAVLMLRTLSGKTHYVITALAVRDRDDRVIAQADKTYVRFRELNEDAIKSYVESKEPMDKAGAYGIQGMGELLVDGLEGSLHNVIGFPIEMFVRMMRELRS